MFTRVGVFSDPSPEDGKGEGFWKICASSVYCAKN